MLKYYFGMLSTACLLHCSLVLGDIADERAFQRCVQEMSISLGRYETVAQAMSSYRVPQSQWVPIIGTFQRKLLNLKRDLEEAASKQVPNPLRPYNGVDAKQLLQSVIIKLWKDSLAVSSAGSNSSTDAMLRYIIQHQSNEVRRCIMDDKTKETESPTVGVPAPVISPVPVQPQLQPVTPVPVTPVIPPQRVR